MLKTIHCAIQLFRSIFFLLHNYEPVTKLQSTTLKHLIWEHAQTFPYNGSLRILRRKRKVLHHHLSWHRRWWNCDRQTSVGDSDVDVCSSDKTWHALGWQKLKNTKMLKYENGWKFKCHVKCFIFCNEFQCRNRSAGSIFDNRYTLLQSVTGEYSKLLPLAVTPNDSLRSRCHHLLHMLDKFCHKLSFSVTCWLCHNACERVMKTFVHIS